jgi:hypothetical protein
METVRSERNALLSERSAAADQAALDAMLEQFAYEELAIDTELETLRDHRRAVELQREMLEQEKAELEALLFGEGANNVSARGAEETTGVPETSQLADIPGATAADLEDSRAGIRLGDGMNVSLGLTRNASVNGVEQFSDSVDLGRITSGIDWSTLQIGLGGIVLQNGTANTIAAGALDSVSAGFGTLLQNTLDDQFINTETIYDVRIEDVSRAISGISAGQALDDALRFQQ